MEGRGDSWESGGWEAAWQQPEEDADREEVLRLARQREAQGNKALAQHRSLEHDVDMTEWAASVQEFDAAEMKMFMEEGMDRRVSPEARC